MIFNENLAKSKKKLLTNKSDSDLFKIIMTYFFELAGVHNSDNLKNLVSLSKSLKIAKDFDQFWKENDP